MKNTRISKLKRNKKFKQATKLLAIGLLICPLAIGTINTFAEDQPATIGDLQTEDSQTETLQTAESTSNEEQTIQSSDAVLPEASGETEATGEQLPEPSSSEAILPSEEQATEVITGAAPTLETAISDVAPLKEYEEIFARDIDRTALVAAFTAYNGLNEVDYTPESWEIVMDKIHNDPLAGGWSLWEAVSTYYAEDPNMSFGMDGPEYEEQGGLLSVLQARRDYVSNTLLSAINELVPKGEEQEQLYVRDLDLTLIEKAYNDRNALNKADYTPESWALFIQDITGHYVGGQSKWEIVAQAYAATRNPDAVLPTEGISGDPLEFHQSSVDGRASLILNAINDILVPKGEYEEIFENMVDRSSVEQAYNAYMALNEADYTPESWSLFINNGISGLTFLDMLINYYNMGPNYSHGMDDESYYDEYTNGLLDQVQSGHDQVAGAVLSLIDTVLVPKGEDPETPTMDKLESSIKDAESKLTESSYTEESMKALRQALQNAKDVLDNTNSTQAEIDEAQKALDLAIAGLVKAEDLNGNNTGNNGSNGTGNSTNDPNTSNNGTNNTNNQTNSNNNQNSTTATTKPTNNNTNKDSLPQTGEQSTSTAVITGLSLTMLSILAWLKRKKV